MPHPNFFIVGAAKCGTTSLHAYLSQHPDIFLSTPKEPHFFDVDMPSTPSWCVRDPKAYEKLFSSATSHKIIGEASPSYLPSAVAAERIKAYNPDAKILISLRNPIDFMYSLHQQFISSCNEDLIDFRDALEVESDRAQGRRIPRSAHYPAHLLYRQNARFSEQIERYYQHFGKNQVKVILLEDLGKDSESVFHDLLQFLELDDPGETNLQPKNIGKDKRVRNIGVRQWLKRHPSIMRMLTYLPPIARQKLGDTIQSVTQSSNVKTIPMNPEHREELLQEFAPEITRLGALISRDLSHWISPDRLPANEHCSTKS